MISWLETRPSMELAVMFVTWAAIFLLSMTVASLHYRLSRLEHASRVARSAAPYGHLVGRHVWTAADGSRPRVVLLLSAGCPSCEAILEELRSAPPAWKVAVAWKDVPPPKNLPDRVRIIPDGPRLMSD